MIQEFIFQDFSHNLIGTAAILFLIWLIATASTLLFIISKSGRMSISAPSVCYPPLGTGIITAEAGKYTTLMAAKSLTIFLSKLYAGIEISLFILAFIYI